MNKREFLKLNALIVGGAMLNPIPSFALFTPQKNNGDFLLPDLDYAFNALEPFVDAMTMEIHHGKHHAGYVSKLNAAIKGTSFEGKTIEGILASIGPEDTAVRNNAGGHYNHTLFWKVLTPNKNTKPSAKLTEAINQSFGSTESLKERMMAAGKTVFGSGWAWLVLGEDRKLAVLASSNQDNPMMLKISPQTGKPIFGIDVWEHAYYLKYQNKRGDYLSSIWEIINWEEVSLRYEAALPKPKNKELFEEWAELNDFHTTMSQTFHPAEGGDLAPIKARSKELAQKAATLAKSSIPAAFSTPQIMEAVQQLERDSKILSRLTRKRKTTDAQITQSLTALHGVFHKIVGLCREGMH